ncbi:MAG TPA: saccharopine dehydrogenase NADP-binding domain-containing protein [Thermoanaerobaculia bacterium]|nr:saccharopine dehydrogenase NADP-binding domain-containing protein [Thermoanaerobaculia bacterium]
MAADTPASFLLYGAYGYTGELIAREAAARGLRPLLAGRDPGRLGALGEATGLPWRAFDLADGAALRETLAGAPAVLHCAGPFVHTYRPMVEACLERRVHYLDITGEAAVFTALADLGPRAAAAGVTLLPGAGFDVAPSDCLAAHLKRRLPGATQLTLAFRPDAAPSRGTAATMAEHAHEGGLVRRDGMLVRVPVAWRTRQVDFGDGPQPAVTIPWGDVVTAWYTTGIPNIEVYAAMPERVIRRLRRSRPLVRLLGLAPLRRLAASRARRRPPGPSAEKLERGETRLWGEVRDAASGEVAAARQRGPQAYRWTVLTALAAVQRVAAGEVKPGFTTPAGAFGADFVLGVGVEREDLTPSPR